MRACEFIVESVDFEQMQPQNIVAVAQQAFAQLYPGIKLYGRSVVEGVGLTTAKGQQGAASAFAGSDTVRGAFYLTVNAYAEGNSMIVVVEDATAGNYKGAATAVIKALFEAGERLYKTQQRELVINDNANVEAWTAIADRVGAEMMEATELIKEYKINNQSGIGSVPKNQEIDYFGLRVAMRPSTFLKLALPLPTTPQDQESIEYVKQQKDTQGIGAPFLEIDIPEGWESGDLSKPARVVGHDGRHRMAAIMQSEGDDPIEVHLFPMGLRRRHFDANPEWAQHLNQVIVGQRGNTVRGPIFQETAMNESLVSYFDTMEDFTGAAKPGSRPGSIKHKAAAYLGKDSGEKLSQTDLKRLRAKANKMKKSGNKAERQRGIQLSRQASWYDNFHK